METLRRIVNIASFSVLQDKLDAWLDDYPLNSCDENVSRCMEIIELNARLQAQLVRLLGLTAAQGGVYGGAAVIKSRLLPLLSSLNVGLTYPVDDAALSALAEVTAREREMSEVQDVYETSLKSLEEDLNDTKAEADLLKQELEVKREELNQERRKSVSDKLVTDVQLTQLRSKLRDLEDELLTVKLSTPTISTTATAASDAYTRQINRLKDEIALINARRTLSRSTTLSDVSVDETSSAQRYEQHKLVSRFNEMFITDRRQALDTLRQCNPLADQHDNQRIVFAAVQESFAATRRAFSEYKTRVRSTIALTYTGPETLQQAVQDYISRHSQLLETADLLNDVVNALTRQPRFSLPLGVSFMILHSLIRETCRLAWSMFSLARPLDIAPAASLELFDDTKYRRSYDSDLSAALVTHHIWPCLMQGSRVLVKGEAYAIRGGALLTAGRSRSRSSSPLRNTTSSSLRARSPSPRRSNFTERGRSPIRCSTY